MAFASFIFSIPRITITHEIIAISSPSIGIPLSEERINSLPANIEQNEIEADKKIPTANSLLFGRIFNLPTIINKAHNADIKTADIATFIGERLSKKSAISRPDEKPAPIVVPIYKKVDFSASHIR